MHVLHLPEQYYEQFLTHYLFDLEKNYKSIAVSQRTPGLNSIQSAVNYKRIENVPVRLRSETMREHTKTIRTDRDTSSPIEQSVVHLNQETISRLQAESAQLQERLIIEEDEVQEQPSLPYMSDSIPPIPVIREPIETSPEVDKDWQVVLQLWLPEHWEILRLLCLGQSVQLTIEERKDRRPISRLIDEINVPVDEHIGDLLIDPDTQTLSPHLRVTAENLVSWYYSSKR